MLTEKPAMERTELSKLPSCEFVLVDVFTNRPLSGNQLAVILNGQGLSDGRMLDLAREFNFSETTFVLPARRAEASWRLRCFTPSAEVFGAGHNALGAWWVLAERGLVDLHDPFTSLCQELGERVLPVGVYSEANKPVRVSLEQSKPLFGAKRPDPTALAQALGLDLIDLRVERLEAQAVSTGAAHLLVPVRSLSALERVQINAKALTALARPLGCEGCYLFCLNESGNDVIARARAFFPGIGISEDPATGSAAGPLAAYLASRKLIEEGVWLTVEQGIEMHRPSRIEVRVRGEQVEVAGRSVIVADGRIRLA